MAVHYRPVRRAMPTASQESFLLQEFRDAIGEAVMHTSQLVNTGSMLMVVEYRVRPSPLAQHGPVLAAPMRPHGGTGLRAPSPCARCPRPPGAHPATAATRFRSWPW